MTPTSSSVEAETSAELSTVIPESSEETPPESSVSEPALPSSSNEQQRLASSAEQPEPTPEPS